LKGRSPSEEEENIKRGIEEGNIEGEFKRGYAPLQRKSSPSP